MYTEKEFRNTHNISIDILSSIANHLHSEDVIDLTYVFRFSRERMNNIIYQRLLGDSNLFTNVENMDIGNIKKIRQGYRILVGEESYGYTMGGKLVFRKEKEFIMLHLMPNSNYMLSCKSKHFDSLCEIMSPMDESYCSPPDFERVVWFSHNCVEKLMNQILKFGYTLERISTVH